MSENSAQEVLPTRSPFFSHVAEGGHGAHDELGRELLDTLRGMKDAKGFTVSHAVDYAHLNPALARLLLTTLFVSECVVICEYRWPTYEEWRHEPGEEWRLEFFPVK